MKKKKREQIMSIRLTDEELERVEKAALVAGESPRDLCRLAVLERVSSGAQMLSKTERFLLEELARVRFLTGNGFALMAAGTLNTPKWEEAKKKAEERADDLVKFLIGAYAGHWFLAQQAESPGEEGYRGE